MDSQIQWMVVLDLQPRRNPSMMKLLIQQLAKESFFEIIFVLLIVHRNEAFVKTTFSLLLLDSISDDWKNGNEEKFIQQ